MQAKTGRDTIRLCGARHVPDLGLALHRMTKLSKPAPCEACTESLAEQAGCNSKEATRWSSIIYLVAKGVIVKVVDVRHVNRILKHTPAKAQLTSCQQHTALVWTWRLRMIMRMLSSSEAPD